MTSTRFQGRAVPERAEVFASSGHIVPGHCKCQIFKDLFVFSEYAMGLQFRVGRDPAGR